MEALLRTTQGRRLLKLGPAAAVLTACFLLPRLDPWFQLALSLAATALVYLAASAVVNRAARACEEECRLNEELLQSQKMAAIGQLSSGIAHEINTPLAVIGQEAELALLDLEGANLSGRPELDSLRDNLRQVALQVDRCRDITHKLLSLSRKLEAIVQDTDVNALVEDMAALVDKEARLRNVDIRRNLAAQLPAAATDPALLRQVVLNLLNNAMQAVGRDGRVTVTTDLPQRDRLRIAVTDSGPGIPPENLPRIFNPFFTTKPPGQGTGLGLSMCLTIMQRLGGTITASNLPGQGAHFEITLPLRPRKAQG